MKTRITELLGCEYPLIQGGMAWVAEHSLPLPFQSRRYRSYCGRFRSY